jgi:hypothetical protein
MYEWWLILRMGCRGLDGVCPVRLGSIEGKRLEVRALQRSGTRKFL